MENGLEPNNLRAIEEVDPLSPIPEIPWSAEKYVIEKAGDLGTFLALGFVLLRWLAASGLITEWRKGQQALAKLADQLENLSTKLDRHSERTRDQIDHLSDRVDRLSEKVDKIDRK